MSMTDPNVLLDAIVTALRSCTALTTLLGASANIFPYYENMDGTGTNFEQLIQEQPNKTLMVAWAGTRTGNFGKLDTIKHDFALYLRSPGKVGELFTLVREGVCVTPTNQKFKLTQVHANVRPPEDMACQRQSKIIAQNLAIYDFWALTFTLTERGVDN